MTKSLLLTALSVLCSWVTLLGIPAYPGLVPYQQPDGSKIMIRMQGDEWGVRFFTENGDEMRQLPDGTLRRATAEDLKAIDSELQASGAARVQRRGKGLGTAYIPHRGKVKALIILVEFTDRKFSVQDPRGYYEYFMSLPGFNYDDGVGSVKQYFDWQSDGQFDVQFDVYGPVQMDKPISSYCPRSNVPNLVKDATSKLDSQINFADYDVDGDGDVDNVYIIFAGIGANYTGDQNTSIWPHNWNVGGSLGISTTYRDGKKLDHYAITCELGAGQSRVGIGPFIHEFCHALGLPDHYNSSGGGATGVTDYTPGQWDVMDQGCYLGAGRRPCNFSAHELMAMDWVQPAHTLTTQTANVILPIFDLNKWFVKVDTGRANDYYLLENRGQEGWDMDLPASGMLIWHIDAGYSDISSTPNNDRNHMAVDLIRADNIYSVTSFSSDAYPTGANTAFGANTTPQMFQWQSSSSSTKVPVTGREISGITRSGSTGLVQFRYNGGNDNNVLKPSDIDIQNVIIRVEADPADGGTVSVGQGNANQYQAIIGDMPYIYAEPNSAAGYRFVNWTLDGKEVSTAKNTLLRVTDISVGGTYVAHFEKMQSGDDDYCYPSAAPNPKFGNRYISALQVSAGDTETNISDLQTGSSSAIYQDKSAVTVKVHPGETVKIRPTAPGSGEWRHSYFYIDWENDGFHYDGPSTYLDTQNGYALRDGVELMYFSNWRADDNDASPWYTSAPSFLYPSTPANFDVNSEFEITIPATTKPGKYRARYKCHWQSLDPCGNRDSSTDSNNNIECMGGTVIDFTIEVEEELVGDYYYFSATTQPEGVGLAKVNGSTAPLPVLAGDKVELSALSWATGRDQQGSFIDYDFVSWTGPNGMVVSYDPDFEITSSAATEGCYTANYKERAYLFTAVAQPADGGIATVNGQSAAEAKKGATVNFAAEAYDGYEFVQWVWPYLISNKPYTSTKLSMPVTVDPAYAGEYVAEFRFIGGNPGGEIHPDIYLREISTEGAGDQDLSLTFAAHPGQFHNVLETLADNSIRTGNNAHTFTLHLSGESLPEGASGAARAAASISNTAAFIFTDWDRDGRYTLDGVYATNPDAGEPLRVAHSVEVPEGLEEGDYMMRLLLIDQINAKDGSFDHINAYASNVQGGISYDLPLVLVRTTGVSAIHVAPEKQGIYDLQGRRLRAVPGPGIYIIDGRKVIVTR